MGAVNEAENLAWRDFSNDNFAYRAAPLEFSLTQGMLSKREILALCHCTDLLLEAGHVHK